MMAGYTTLWCFYFPPNDEIIVPSLLLPACCVVLPPTGQSSVVHRPDPSHHGQLRMSLINEVKVVILPDRYRTSWRVSLGALQCVCLRWFPCETQNKVFLCLADL